MDEMIERAREYVASSMHDRDKSWGDLVRAGERDDCPEMRMVLKAMRGEVVLLREPTEQMKRAGAGACTYYKDRGDHRMAEAYAIYTAMIDEALDPTVEMPRMDMTKPVTR